MISVCIATYNGEKYIRQQLESILHQLSTNDEIIISDDGSTDHTLQEINNINDARIQIFHHTPMPSKYTFDYTTHNFENAIRHSHGDIIYLSDQDDVWINNKVKLVNQELENSDLVLTDCRVTNSKLHTIHESYFKQNGSHLGILYNIWKSSYLGCCMAFHRSILKYCLPIPKTLVPHDIWFGLNAEIYGKVTMLNQPTILYRRHENNLSAASSKSDFSNFFRIYYRMIIVANLIIRYFNRKK